MVAGMTTTGSLADSLPTIIDSARIISEFEGVFMRTCETHRLPEGTGLTWDEVSFAKINAENVTETTELDNPQMLSDAILSATPLVSGIQIRITDRAKGRIDKKAAGQIGGLGQNAIQRKKDTDYHTVLDGFTNSYCGAGSTLTSGHISAAVATIEGNTTEPPNSPLYTVLHPIQIKDIQDEIVQGIGTYTIPSGMSEETFRKGFSGSLFGTNVFLDGNIAIDSASDSKGGVHARRAVVLVQGFAPRSVTVRKEHIGGGAEDLFLYDEYVYVERGAANPWGVEIYSDTTAPTS